MEKTSGNFRISGFRHRFYSWVVLFFLAWSWMPTVSVAQQPTATITAVSGIVLVNGQQQQATTLTAGDILETQPGAFVVLTLSDGSTLEVGEKTQLALSELTQTMTQARVSRVKLLWGWVRAKLSPDHQHAGSSFDIETPNAVIGVKFSQPDVEVSYDPAQQATIGIAHTVELIALNLVTNERIVVPVGSSVVIIGLLMKVVAGTNAVAIAAEVSAAETSAAAETAAGTTAGSGIGTGTLVALGVGAVAAAGGVATVVASSGGDDSSNEQPDTANDLQGVWSLTCSRSDGLVARGSLTMDSQGNIVDFSGPRGLLSFTGSLTVSVNDSVAGTLSFQNDYEAPSPCLGHIETTTLTMQGNFVSKNIIEGTMIWAETSTCPSDPPENLTGTFTLTK